MRLFECARCGFVWLDPLPDPAEVAFLYQDTAEGATTGYFAKVARKLARSRGRVRQILRLLPGGAKGKTFLDIGANGGFMSEAAREAGFSTIGIEPDGNAVAFARRHFPGNDFRQGLLETTELDAQSIDVAYCSEVIEHVADCNRFMARLALLLKPGALLYLTTPDISHWRRPKLERWDAFCPPAHCLYFNPRNLRMLLERHGFAIVRKRLAFKPGIKILARKLAAQAQPPPT